MTHDTENTAADIAWMRQLAEEGGRAPLRGASILMAGGLLYGLASLFQWAIVIGALPWSMNVAGMGWIAVTVAFWGVLAVVIPRLKREPGVQTAANKAAGVAWSAMGWGIFMLFLSMGVLAWRLGADATTTLFVLMPSVILVFYAVGWAVSATMFRSRPMWMLSVASFIAAPVLAAMAATPVLYLAYAIALFGLMALPGYVFMRAASR